MQTTKGSIKGNLVGRKTGVPNRITLGVKTALADAFHALGGTQGLIDWGNENRGEFYKLWVKMLPPQKAAGDTGGLTIQILKFGDDPGKITQAPIIENTISCLPSPTEESGQGQDAQTAGDHEED